MTVGVSLQLLLLAVIGICLIIQTVTLHSTTQIFRRTLARINDILHDGERLLTEATRTLGEGRQLLHRANRATHGVEEWVEWARSFFAGRFGNGARAGPRRGVIKR